VAFLNKKKNYPVFRDGKGNGKLISTKFFTENFQVIINKFGVLFQKPVCKAMARIKKVPRLRDFKSF
jgi:hypothetical protein